MSGEAPPAVPTQGPPAGEGPAGGAPPIAPDGTPQAQGAAPAPPVGEQRVHLYEVAANQRERVLTSFDTQRAAILKAVADQRAAAVAPILAVQARLAAGQAIGPAATQAANATEIGRAAANAAPRLQANLNRPHAVAAEIVATIKLLVAEEVRVQLQAVLRALCQSRSPAEARAETPSPNPGTTAG